MDRHDLERPGLLKTVGVGLCGRFIGELRSSHAWQPCNANWFRRETASKRAIGRVILRIVSTITAFVLVACSDRPGSSNVRNTREVIIDLERQHAWLIEGQNAARYSSYDGPRWLSNASWYIRHYAKRTRLPINGLRLVCLIHFRTGRSSGNRSSKSITISKGVRFEGAHMDYYMEFAAGIGMHAGDLTAYPSSHGCVRLPVAAARKFFQLLDIGCIVQVQNSSRPSYHSGTSAFNPLN